MRFNPALLSTDIPPIPEARRWLDGLTFPNDQPLLDVSQAAPSEPPPVPLRQHIADLALNLPAAHLYGPVLGLEELREEVAKEWRTAYGGEIRASQVAITPGCNQAFVAALTAIAGPGDEVILPTPWYFNHKMALDMATVRSVPLTCRSDLLPDPDRARSLITDRTRAIVLVTPNNPTGTEYPADLISAFHDLARAAGIALILDETYRDFHASPGAPHALFRDPDWHETVIDLYSFSKTYRLMGHRVGAIVASEKVLHEIEKVQDTQVICANQLGQRAALWGMQNLRKWRAGEREEILKRRATLKTEFEDLAGWDVMGLGAYFAFVSHPYDAPSADVARMLVREAGILALPATMFAPEEDPVRQKALRIAFANINSDGIREMSQRLDRLGDSAGLALV